MRILHVVSLVDPEGSFGGPLRVAVNQLRALQEEGHEVLLAAGVRGYDGSIPENFDGVPLKGFKAVTLVPGTGFAGLSAPGLTPWLLRVASTFDAVHVHLARDLVSLPAAALLAARDVAFVAQTHGMIDVSDKALAQVLDAAMTRRTLRAASTIFALTALEKVDLAEVEPSLETVEVLHNGVPLTEVSAAPHRSQEVLFLARVATRKRPVRFVEMAQRVAAAHPEATFALVGPDEGEGGAVRAMLQRDDANGRIRYEGALAPDRTLERMSRAAVYVLPADHEPFGMTIFEAMSVGLPVVVMSDCGLAAEVREAGGEVVTDETLEERVAALLADPSRRLTSGESGRALVRERAGMTVIVERLLTAYRRSGMRA